MDEFTKRLTQACDDSPAVPAVPAFGKGRQSVIKDAMGVSQEAVRKRFAGEARPRRKTMEKLAKYLGVELTWLAMGVAPDLSRADKLTWSALADGAAYVLFGLITAAGGRCAFAEEKKPGDQRADLYAIIKGQQYAFCVVSARETGEGRYTVHVPREHEHLNVIGFIPREGFRFDLIRFTPEGIANCQKRKIGVYELSIDKRAKPTARAKRPGLPCKAWTTSTNPKVCR